MVVPTYGRPASLARCLAAVAAQTRLPEQVVVACRADDQLTFDALPSLTDIIDFEVVSTAETRLTAQMDLGVGATTADVVALTDDDAAPHEDWIERLLALYGEPNVGAVGGRDAIADPTVDSMPVNSPVGVITWRGRPLGNHHREGHAIRDVDILKGVNLSLRRPLWHVDQDLMGRGNQSHWELGVCLHVRRLGWRVLYDPAIVVDHFTEARVGEAQRAVRDAYAYERDAHNELYELVRWLPRWQWPIAAANALLVGSRAEPGLLVGMWLAASGTPRTAGLDAMRASMRGRLAALRARPRAGTTRSKA